MLGIRRIRLERVVLSHTRSSATTLGVRPPWSLLNRYRTLAGGYPVVGPLHTTHKASTDGSRTRRADRGHEKAEEIQSLGDPDEFVDRRGKGVVHGGVGANELIG